MVDESGVDVDLVGSNLNRSVTLVGANLAVFTFTLFFLYPRYASGQVNGVLFQMTLASTLLAIFLFGICGVCYFEVVGVAKASLERKRMLVKRGDTLFVLSLLLGTAEPALILYTVGIVPIAILATLLWALYAGFIVQQGRKLRAG